MESLCALTRRRGSFPSGIFVPTSQESFGRVRRCGTANAVVVNTYSLAIP